MLSGLSVFFRQVRWVFLQREWCFVVGTILRWSISKWQNGEKTRIVVLPLRGKWRGFAILIGFFLSALCHLAYGVTLFLANLIPWDACWIAVLGWSNSSRCSKFNGLLIMDVMPIWDYTMNGLSYKYFNINRRSTVICLPCHLPAFERDTTSEPMAPGLFSITWFFYTIAIFSPFCYLLPSISITCVLACN